MTALFYVSAAIAIISAAMVVTRTNAAHALIYLVLLFLATASVFLTQGAPLVAALQIVVYAGAIIVLFVFVVMMLNEGRVTEQRERRWIKGRIWILPLVLAAALLAQFVAALTGPGVGQAGAAVGPKAVGISLFTDYLIGVELASMLLLAALVAAFHFGLFPNRQDSNDE